MAALNLTFIHLVGMMIEHTMMKMSHHNQIQDEEKLSIVSCELWDGVVHW